MLEGVERLLCNQPFINHFSQVIVPVQKQHRDKIDIAFIQQHIIPSHLKFFRKTIHQILDKTLRPIDKASISCKLEPFISRKFENYIQQQLSNTLNTLNSTQGLEQTFACGLHGLAWKLTDNIIFMNHDWGLDFPVWTCELSSPYFQQNALIMQLPYGIVIMSFAYPNN
ncbi:hypothetical protein [Acinetobacter sp. ANC 5502]